MQQYHRADYFGGYFGGCVGIYNADYFGGHSGLHSNDDKLLQPAKDRYYSGQGGYFTLKLSDYPTVSI